MKIVVVGGTGLIGSKLVAKLEMAGHEAVAASPDSGVNTITGAGVAKAVAGARVVVDVSNSPSFEDEAVLEFFQTSTRNLLAAEIDAGVRHHVVLSIVGTERLRDSGYVRAKIAQEILIRNSRIPYTIVHSTQFFEFVSRIVQAGTEGQSVRLPTAFVQPIAAEDVATTMLDYILGEPRNGTVEIAGPQRFRLSDLGARYLSATRDPRTVVPDAHARYFGAELRDHTLIPGLSPRMGKVRFDNWLGQVAAPGH